MIDPYKIIIRPVVTEKTTSLAQAPRPKSEYTLNQYTFEVARGASKSQIREALERWWLDARGVRIHVVRVNTMNVHPKRRRTTGKQILGLTRTWKKAVVTLQDGDSLDVY